MAAVLIMGGCGGGRADVMAFPNFTNPVLLSDLVAESFGGGVDDKEASQRPPERLNKTYQPIVAGGYENLRFTPGNRVET